MSGGYLHVAPDCREMPGSSVQRPGGPERGIERVAEILSARLPSGVTQERACSRSGAGRSGRKRQQGKDWRGEAGGKGSKEKTGGEKRAEKDSGKSDRKELCREGLSEQLPAIGKPSRRSDRTAECRMPDAGPALLRFPVGVGLQELLPAL